MSESNGLQRLFGGCGFLDNWGLIILLIILLYSSSCITPFYYIRLSKSFFNSLYDLFIPPPLKIII